MKQKTKIAVLGLGAMGSRMALRWLKAGYEVIVWNRTPQKSETLKNENAKVAASPREAAHRADVVVSMVRDNDASHQVWLTEGTGAIHGLNAGAIAIESSTLTPDWIQRLTGKISETGASFIEHHVWCPGGHLGRNAGVAEPSGNWFGNCRGSSEHIAYDQSGHANGR